MSSISNEQSLVDKNIDGQEIKGKLSLDFVLNLKQMTYSEALNYGVLTKKVLSTVAISAVTVASGLEGLFLTTANA